ncbi:ribosome hibernation-promoting factor, HPF/YfiA family [Symbiobacterium thermophilum]|uniref:ribosome hibernation-promoting factor, HPF/YfiA family n=1 Tax=Symbiobacterium thermophilum TaxID=2734 RepID=UPI0035C77E37
MQVAVRGKNIEITKALREYVEKKLGKIEKFVDHPIKAQANLYVERGRHIIEVTADLNGWILRGEEATGDMYASIDLVADKLEKQVQRYRARLRRRGGAGVSPEAAVAGAEDQGVDAELDGKVVKVKRFPVKPVTVDEAILQMDLLSHDFFVFVNSDTGKVNVLYRRHDGDYGLLVPEY